VASKIVVGYDGSDASKAALDKAVELAKCDPGAEITVVCGQDRPPAWVTYRGPTVEAQAYIEQIEKEIAADLEEAAKVVSDAGIKVATTCTRDRPVDLLLNVAHEIGASWIVVGAKGAGAVRDVVMGSTTMKLLHKSDIPVVVVPTAD